MYKQQNVQVSDTRLNDAVGQATKDETGYKAFPKNIKLKIQNLEQ